MGVLSVEEPVFSAFLGCISDVKQSKVSRLSNLLQTLNLRPQVFGAPFLSGMVGVISGGAVPDVRGLQARLSVPTTSLSCGMKEMETAS